MSLCIDWSIYCQPTVLSLRTLTKSTQSWQHTHAANTMGMTGMIKHIWRAEGLAGFFKGFGSSLACHVTYSFLWWVSCRSWMISWIFLCIYLFKSLLMHQFSHVTINPIFHWMNRLLFNRWASYSTTRRQVAYFFPSLPANHTILYDAVTGILAGGLL